MVCKEEVIGWFKDLSGFKRIDFMCGLLNMCVPFELRFFGTCVEDLGKKDFHYLREAEHRANSTAEIAKLTNLNDDVTRSKLIVSLALLKASNHVCANVIFQTLTDAGKVAHSAATAVPASALPSPKSSSPAIVEDPKIGEEIFLLFTMALHHPAFTFDQKSSLGELLKTIKALFKAAATTTCEESNVVGKSKDDSIDSLDSKSSSTSCAQSFSSGGGATTIRTTIKHLEMKRFQKRKQEKKSEFRIQVTWSNGDVTEVSKTYQELYDFSLKVQQLLPDDKRSHRQDRSFPVLPALRHIAGHRQSDDNSEDTSGKLSDLVHQFLCRMPPLLLDCDPVTWFFHGQTSHSPQWSSTVATSPSHRSSQGTALSSPRGAVHLGAGSGSRVSPDGGRVKSLTIYNSQIERSGKISQEANKGKLPNSGSPTSCSKEMQTALLTNSIVTHQVSYSSPVSSPQASPASSPFASPSQSGTSSRAASPWIQRTLTSGDGPADNVPLNHMVKQERSKRPRGKLTNCSVDEHKALTDDDLMKPGISPVFINQIKALDNRNPPNGLNLHTVLERTSASNPTNPSSVAPTVTSGGLSFSGVHSDVNNPSAAQLYPNESLGRHSSYPVMPQPPSLGAPTHGTSCNSMSTVTGMPGVPTMIPCNTLHHPAQQPHRQSVAQFHSSQQQPSMHCQVQPQRRAASAESSPSSQNSSPPESPSLDSRNHYDSSCSEEMDKDKELGKSKVPDLGHVQKNCSLKTKGIENNALSNVVPSKGRTEEESHYLVAPVGMVSTPRPEIVNTMMPPRPTVLPDLTSVTVTLPVASVPMNSAAAFQRTRLNPASTPSPPGSVVHAFKSGPQHVASPVRNSNNTIIIENSQFVKTLSSGAPTVPAVAAPSAHSRWEGMNGSCPPSTMNGSNAQPQPPNPALFIFTTAQVVTQAENVAVCRTCTTCVSSPSMVVSCASRHPLPQVTSSNMSSVVRAHNNKLNSSSHLGDDTLKVNSNTMNLSMPPTTACLPCVGQTEPPSPHPIPSYPPPSISYPSMPPSPVAPTTVTYTTPAFVPASNGPLANSQPANTISPGQVPHNTHGGMPPVSTGCSNTCACSCSGATPPGNLPYSPGFLHIHQMSSAVFAGFPGFLQPHNTNGFISPTLPNFPFAGGHLTGAIPNGITPELIYSGSQFPMLQQQQNGSHHSTTPATPGFLPGPAPNLAYHSNYTNNPSSQSLLKGKNVSCYNCGIVGHRGIDCKEATMEEITKPGQFRLNYSPSSKPMESTE